MSTNGHADEGGPEINLREKIIEHSETLKEVVKGLGTINATLKTMGDNAAKRQVKISEEFGAIHAKLDATKALAEQTRALAEHSAVRMARIDNDREVTVSDVRKMRKTITAATTQLADLDKREAVNMAATSERLNSLDKREQTQDDRLNKTDTVVIDVATRAAARASAAEIIVEAAPTKEERVEVAKMETSRAVWVAVIGGVVAVVIAVISTVAATRATNTPPHLQDSHTPEVHGH